MLATFYEWNEFGLELVSLKVDNEEYIALLRKIFFSYYGWQYKLTKSLILYLKPCTVEKIHSCASNINNYKHCYEVVGLSF